jgi:heme/copper-type cytochrome/quinol oxidase subunit 2
VIRALLVAAAAIAAVALFLALRPEGEDGRTTAQPAERRTETTAAETAATTTTTPEATPAPKPKTPTLLVRVRNGEVAGGVQRVRIEKDARVRIVVRSDVADHVHVHGYDVMVDVGPGKPARIALQANLTGRFEIELEDRKLLIAELEVRP